MRREPTDPGLSRPLTGQPSASTIGLAFPSTFGVYQVSLNLRYYGKPFWPRCLTRRAIFVSCLRGDQCIGR
jgi:hypothetical protein